MMSKKRKRRKGNTGFFFFSGFIFIVLVFLVISKRENKIDEKLVYIEETKYLAIQTAKKYNLFASVILAQSALESNFGNSELSKKYNNYFGIKATSKSDYVEMNTSEFYDDEEKILKKSFRVYKSKSESFKDYGTLISKAGRYEKVRDAQNPYDAAKALQKSGYATDPSYAEKIISIIEKYNLEELDGEIID